MEYHKKKEKQEIQGNDSHETFNRVSQTDIFLKDAPV
jgi:hypothetical protein